MTQSSTTDLSSTPYANPVAGIIAMSTAMACFIFSDVFTKLASEALPVGEVVAIRGLFSTLVFLIPAAIFGYLRLIRTHMSKAWLGRILGEMGAAITFVSALAHMPIANVTAIANILPLVMTAVGALFLGEYVGLRRWTATVAGFLGVLLIAKPGTESFSWWALVPLATVAVVIMRDIATRRIPPIVPPILLTATTAAGVTLSGLVLGLTEPTWPMPDVQQLSYLFCAAIAVASGYYFSILAVQRAPLSTVAPFRYSVIPMSLCAGFLVWGEKPALTDLLGIAIILMAGLYTFLRERHRARAVDRPNA